MMKIINTTNLSKSYGKKQAVKGINLTINEGQIYGILGPNGAGKSTTINMLCGLLKPSSGTIDVFNKSLAKNSKYIKNNIGLVPQEIAIYEDLTALENVKFFGSLYGLTGKALEQAAKKSLEFVGLQDRAKDKPAKYSGGMKRRLNIACAIVHEPRLIIMDEPTVGIDPQSRNHILESIKKLNNKGCTVLYTSHYMEEVQAICSHIAIIDNGEIIEHGQLSEIIDKHSQTRIIKVCTLRKITDKSLENKLGAITGVEMVKVAEKEITIYNHSDQDNLADIILLLKENEVKINNIESKLNDLETIFLNLTGKNLRD